MIRGVPHQSSEQGQWDPAILLGPAGCIGLLVGGSTESVAHTTNGADGILVTGFAQLLAESADMDIDGALFDMDVAAPDPIKQLRARPDTTGLFKKGCQKPVFGGPEHQLGAIPIRPVFAGFHDDVLERDPKASIRGSRSAQLHLEAGQKFGDGIRFHHVIISPAFEAKDTIHFVFPGGNHDDRDCLEVPGGADHAAEFNAGEFRDHPVEQHDVREFGPDGRPGIPAIGGGGDGIPCPTDIVFKQLEMGGIVLDNQDEREIFFHRLRLCGVFLND